MQWHCFRCLVQWEGENPYCFACGRGGSEGPLRNVETGALMVQMTSRQVTGVALSDNEKAEALAEPPPYWLA